MLQMSPIAVNKRQRVCVEVESGEIKNNRFYDPFTVTGRTLCLAVGVSGTSAARRRPCQQIRVDREMEVGAPGNCFSWRDQCLLLLCTIRGERWQTVRHHLRTLAQYGCHQHELPVCSVTTLSHCPALSVHLYVSVIHCQSAFVQYVCQSVCPSLSYSVCYLLLSVSLTLSHALCKTISFPSFSLFLALSSRLFHLCCFHWIFLLLALHLKKKRHIMMFLSVHTSIPLYFCSITLRVQKAKEINLTKTFGFWVAWLHQLKTKKMNSIFHCRELL